MFRFGRFGFDRYFGVNPKRELLRISSRFNGILADDPEQRRILLLQGPVGPFFKMLQLHLESCGYDTWRVCLNAGDRFYSSKHKRINFQGSPLEWEGWLADAVELIGFDCIILFGSERPAHLIARKVAARGGIKVLSLEEGYIRPGFVTVESDGNNASSPLCNCLPPASLNYDEQPEFSHEDFKGFRPMCVYGTVYYLMHTLFSSGRQSSLFHRHISPGREVFCWARNAMRRFHGQARKYQKLERLLEHHDGAYYLVPLQVETDAQMQDAALGWSTIRLISTTLKSFTKHAPADRQLVFKIHPLGRGHFAHRRLIEETAAAYGIGDRVEVVDAGSLGLLARHAAGMITINSTSGLSAIHHGTPLLVLGRTFYAHPKLAVCAEEEADLDAFWGSGHVADRQTRMAYLRWVRHEALMVGDYYADQGMSAACRSIASKLRRSLSGIIDEVQARSAC